MASEMRAKVIDFAIHLPSNVNPYNALAQHLMEINKVPTLPLWSVLLQSGTILLYCGMLSGAIWLLRQRILTKNFRLVTISNLGLIEIDLITTWGLLGALYALISIPDLIYWQLVLTGKCRLSGGEIIVFGCKFVLLLHMSWAFLWVCACHWVTASYTKTWMHPIERDTASGLRPLLRYFLNGFYLTGVFLSYAVIAYLYSVIGFEYNSVNSILQNVINELYARAPEYHSLTYTDLDPLKVLLQADTATVHFGKMIEFYQMSSAFYLIAISFLCMIYFPMWAFSLRNLYGLSSSLVERCNSAEADQNTLIKHAQTIKVRKRLILIQAILVAGVTLAHAPILIAQLMCYKPAQVYVDKSWFIFTIVGLHLPSAIWGNGFFLFLNLNLDPNKSIHNRDPLRKIENVAPTFEIFHAKISNQSEGKTNSDCSMKNDD